jgi:hypothetical protein
MEGSLTILTPKAGQKVSCTTLEVPSQHQKTEETG